MLQTSPSNATIATYFRFGIESEICAPDEARAWAIAVIDAMDTPPGEFIEIAWRKPVSQLVEDLRLVQGEVDLPMLRHWLLARLRESTPATPPHTDRLIRQAMQISQREVPDEDLCYRFDIIADQFHLASSGIYGNVSDCLLGFDAILAEFIAAPFDYRS